MIPPNCPEHGRLVLDLALGRLEDEAAIRAEAVSESCPVCRAWWQQHFGHAEVGTVDDAVAATFGILRLPARRHNHGWLAAAAAMVMAFGVGTLWVSYRATTTYSPSAPKTASIRTLDFEVPEAIGELAVIEVPDPDPDPAPVAMAVAAQVTIEETVIAEASPAVVADEESSKVLFAGSFESGDLGAWVPKT